MIELDVDPKTVWGFHEGVGVSKSLVEFVRRNGFDNLPRVPVFEIPLDIRKNGHLYMLADGNHRRNVAEYLKMNLPISLFRRDEEMDLFDHKLAYFRNIKNTTKHDFYVKLLNEYIFQNNKTSIALQL